MHNAMRARQGLLLGLTNVNFLQIIYGDSSMGDLQTRPLGDENFSTSSVATGSHKVLRNTYMLLSMTLLFSAGMAGVAMAIDAPYMGWIPLIVAFALLFAINKFKNSSVGIALVFVFTGILGFFSRANFKLLPRIAGWYSDGSLRPLHDRYNFFVTLRLRLDHQERLFFHGGVSNDRNVGRYRKHSPDAGRGSFRMAVVRSSFSDFSRDRYPDVRLHSFRH